MASKRRRMTNEIMLSMEHGEHAFTINWARNQYGNATARAIATLIRDGHDVSISFGGFFVDGTHYAGVQVLTWPSKTIMTRSSVVLGA